MATISRMVSVSGQTYRITRIQSGIYEVIRIVDDKTVGRFQPGPPLKLEVVPGMEEAMLRHVASTAMQTAKVSWVGKIALV